MADRILVNHGGKNRAQQAIDEIKRRYAAGEPFLVVFSEPGSDPSHGQKGYYWAMMNLWGRSLGYDRQEIQDILHRAVKCRAFGVEKEIDYGGMVIQVPKKRSRDATKSEYQMLIDAMIIMAAEDGFVIPEPYQEAG